MKNRLCYTINIRGEARKGGGVIYESLVVANFD